MIRFRPALLGLALLLAACSSGGNPDGGPDDPLGDGGTCSCETGARRCNGASIQVCEASSPTCSSWGPVTGCPAEVCQAGACPGACTDQCAGGTARCGDEATKEICRIGPSGCLEWVRQACGPSLYCGDGQCKEAVPCGEGCPTGYSCRPSGVCAGGDPRMLVLNVKTFPVSGKITVNGADPTNDAECTAMRNPDATRAYVSFTDRASGYNFDLAIRCRDAGYTFSAFLYPGTYEVRVRGEGWQGQNLPGQSFQIDKALPLNAARAGLIFDVKTFSVAGKITVNGANPTNDAECTAMRNPDATRAYVSFTDRASGHNFDLAIRCRDAGYTFSAFLYPGTYEVRVRGEGWQGQNLPGQSFQVDKALPLNAARAGLVFDVKTFSVAGKITVNGADPTNDAECTAMRNPDATRAYASFTDRASGYNFDLAIRCRDPGYTLSAFLYPGTYEVRVRSEGWQGQNLPGQSFQIDKALPLNAARAGLIFDVKTFSVAGKITVNGANPTNDAECTAMRNPDATRAYVSFTDRASGYNFDLAIRCRDAGYTFSASLYPGTYEVRVRGEGWQGQNLPGQSFQVDKALPLNAARAGLVFDVKTFSVAGKITVNGANPTNDAECTAMRNPDATRAYASFTDRASGYNFDLAIRCRDAGYTFSAFLYPGTYEVRVRGEGWQRQNLPSQSFQIDKALPLNAARAGLVFDVKTFPVAGKITVNGADPTNDAECTAMRNPDATRAYASFTDRASGYNFDLAIRCRDAGYTFSASLYPGTYEVRVRGEGWQGQNLPSQSYQAVPRLALP